ncbi:MAG TPA: lytic transglycosylase domain-containing protein [Acidimicrobiales bacterium]|nr:lytic transglycosylase domain-containing protein [Acidimicrobiales bacterium]
MPLRPILAALVAVLLVALPARPADAQEPTAPTGAPLVAEALGDLSPGLVGVIVEGAGYPAAHHGWLEAGRQSGVAASEAARADARAEELTAVRDLLVEALDVARGHARDAEVREAAARQRLVGVAVAAFRSDDARAHLDAVLGRGDENAHLRRGVLGGAVEVEVVEGLERATEQAMLTRATAEHVLSRLTDVVAEHGAAVVRRDDALALHQRWLAVADQQRQTMAAVARSTRAVAVGLPTAVLDAYWRGSQHPAASCRLPWEVLAGIGRVESRHGTFGGSAPDEWGRVSPRIIGIPLDGTSNTMHIPDTDGGAVDGDAVVDRAVGPMQFIPSTWRAHGVDGNGDGVADPHNLYDAAASAATYLCRALPAGGDLGRAILSYNRSSVYVSNVLGHASAYAAAGLSLGHTVRH